MLWQRPARWSMWDAPSDRDYYGVEEPEDQEEAPDEPAPSPAADPPLPAWVRLFRSEWFAAIVGFLLLFGFVTLVMQ